MTPTPTLLAKLWVQPAPDAVTKMTSARRIYTVRPATPIKHIVAVRSDGTFFCSAHPDTECEGIAAVREYVENEGEMETESEWGSDGDA